jgi:hypothetical protein
VKGKPRLDPAEVQAIYDAELPPEEALKLLRRELDDEVAMAEVEAHIAWFVRRYPTALDRLRYAERMRRAWTRERH